jgi:hypothetical protein
MDGRSSESRPVVKERVTSRDVEVTAGGALSRRKPRQGPRFGAPRRVNPSALTMVLAPVSGGPPMPRMSHPLLAGSAAARVLAPGR